VPELRTVPFPEGGTGFLVLGDGVGVLDDEDGAADGAADEDVGSSRRPLRETRSSVPRLVALGVRLGEPAAVAGTSVGWPSVTAATPATTTIPATTSADNSGTTRDGKGLRCTFGAMELFRSGRGESGSACLPDKIQTFRRQQAGLTLPRVVPNPSSRSIRYVVFHPISSVRSVDPSTTRSSGMPMWCDAESPSHRGETRRADRARPVGSPSEGTGPR
jgi:hypothetical protein